MVYEVFMLNYEPQINVGMSNIIQYVLMESSVGLRVTILRIMSDMDTFLSYGNQHILWFCFLFYIEVWLGND